MAKRLAEMTLCVFQSQTYKGLASPSADLESCPETMERSQLSVPCRIRDHMEKNRGALVNSQDPEAHKALLDLLVSLLSWMEAAI